MDVSYNECKGPRCVINEFCYLYLLTLYDEKDDDVLSGANSMTRIGVVLTKIYQCPDIYE